jgi:hypothetical protein
MKIQHLRPITGGHDNVGGVRLGTLCAADYGILLYTV